MSTVHHITRTDQFLTRVSAVTSLSPRMRRITLTAPALASRRWPLACDIAVVLTADGREVRRRYTVRSVDGSSIVVDAVLHGHGPGSTWAESLQLDDEVTFFGPRGEISLSDASAADWVLCITDEAGLPAVGALVESTDRPVLVLAEIAAADERYPLSPNADVRWLVRADHPAGSADLFTAALDEVVPGQLGSDARTGRGYAYVLAESRAAVVLRDELARFGLSKSEVYAKGYWNLRSRSTR